MKNLALTFDDVTLVPQYSSVLPTEVDVSVQLTPAIKLVTPILSSAMDTVTESKMAIAMAQQGGLGVIHKNMSIDEQVREIQAVKRHSGGVVKDPVTVNPHHDLHYVKNLMRETGYGSFPVVEESRWGMKEGVLAGMITSRDVKFERSDSTLVGNIMTPVSNLWCATEDMSREMMVSIMYGHKVERIPVVRYDGTTPILVGIFNLKDHNLKESYPRATRDVEGRLCVAAAVGSYTEENIFRAEKLIEAGVDALVVDTAHGNSLSVVQMVKRLAGFQPKISIIAGNVVTPDGTKLLFDSGADCVKVGIGPGSICTTRIVSGVGVPQFTALLNCSNAVGENQTLICDGGIRYSGDIVKALVAGADAVMLGGLLAGCDESPGESEIYMGRVYKSYRGMGSLGAMMQKHGSSDRYKQDGVCSNKLVPEGIEGRVPYSGSVENVLTQLVGGLRAGMGYLGCSTIPELLKLDESVVCQVTAAGLRESHPHDVSIIREAPNYSGGLY